jgi:hypothetical protein
MSARLVFGASLLLVIACRKPPPSVLEMEDPCEIPIPFPFSTDRTTPEGEIHVRGLDLWRQCPCHQPYCYVIGSDAAGAVVPPAEVLRRWALGNPSTTPQRLATTALHVLHELSFTKTAPFNPTGALGRRAPSLSGGVLTFLVSLPGSASADSGECLRYDVNLSGGNVDSAAVTAAFGRTCDEVHDAG